MTESVGSVRMMKHFVTNGTKKARVSYSAFVMNSTGKPCVTLYAKSWEDGRVLAEIIPEGYENNTDSMTDYFEKGRVRILEASPLYAQAIARAQGVA